MMSKRIIWTVIFSCFLYSTIDSSYGNAKVLQANALIKVSNTTFTEEDIVFDQYTIPYKSVIIKGVNRVYKEENRCHQLDPGTAILSSSKGTTENPVFFVMCKTKSGNVFNVFFSKYEIEHNIELGTVGKY